MNFSGREMELRDEFSRLTAALMPGIVIESHRALASRAQRADEQGLACAGSMIVVDIGYPLVGARCDTCELEVGYWLGALRAVLGRASW